MSEKEEGKTNSPEEEIVTSPELKQKGWSGLNEPQEVSDEEEFNAAMEESVEDAISWHLMWKSVASSLWLIYNELKRHNDYVMGSQASPIVLLEKPPELIVPKDTPVLQKPVSVLPDNIKEETALEDFFKTQLKDVMTEDKLIEVKISVEKDKVVIRLPWLDDQWAAVNSRLVDDLKAERIVDGRNTRYIILR